MDLQVYTGIVSLFEIIKTESSTATEDTHAFPLFCQKSTSCSISQMYLYRGPLLPGRRLERARTWPFVRSPARFASVEATMGQCEIVGEPSNVIDYHSSLY